MAKFQVGDRVRSTWGGSEFYRQGDTGTVTAVDGEFVTVLWDNPLQPHVNDKGWHAYVGSLLPESAGVFRTAAHHAGVHWPLLVAATSVAVAVWAVLS